jgi:hypothetical protein
MTSQSDGHDCSTSASSVESMVPAAFKYGTMTLNFMAISGVTGTLAYNNCPEQWSSVTE